ncbi:uncharacterized protein si:dkeyp-72g9.4 [Lampris incognitus]|uniref:uncharacterized protein si:dkeyp-72g9.4 n=1 Tax=Lampris incognitus TaxID=2546036 RepID=UPI0024B604BD|nr:uncharacterized protein si:dkeyp-72g9.4 [Lampris incognitus]
MDRSAMPAMRPRSRLLSKRELPLPTIREGTEEMVRDMNQDNTFNSSSHSPVLSAEDYLLSICHLAHPTFPTQDASSDNNSAHPLGSLHPRLRLPPLTGSTSATFELHHRGKAHDMNVLQGDRKNLNDEPLPGCYGNSDPLEYLYGWHGNSDLSTCQSGGERRGLSEGMVMRRYRDMWEGQPRSRAHSVPFAASPDLPRRRKSSCPELHTSTYATHCNHSPKHHSSKYNAMSLSSGRSPEDRDMAGEREGSTVKHSLVSQWISDCKSAWREARVRACMLPVIAEI